MVNNNSFSRFEEVVHEKNHLESPDAIRKKELAFIILSQINDEQEDLLYSESYFHDLESNKNYIDEHIFEKIFNEFLPLKQKA